MLSGSFTLLVAIMSASMFSLCGIVSSSGVLKSSWGILSNAR